MFCLLLWYSNIVCFEKSQPNLTTELTQRKKKFIHLSFITYHSVYVYSSNKVGNLESLTSTPFTSVIVNSMRGLFLSTNFLA